MPRDKVAILDGARTPVGRFGGALKSVPAHLLGAGAVTAALERSGISAEDVGEVIMGCVGQVGPDAYNARRVTLAAGLSIDTPAFTVNRLCGSGLQAIWSGAQELLWGGVDVVVAGGDESMSRMPFLDFTERGSGRLGNRVLVDGTLALLHDPFDDVAMGVTAENVATKYGISRTEQDEFALRSQQRAASDDARAAFAEEIVPVTLADGTLVSDDEHPRPSTSMADLSRLRPVFRADGSVTAGNSSGINDGAAALVLVRATDAASTGHTALATIEHVSTAALEPGLMGYAPTIALKKLFAATGLTPADVEIVELNEAFAAQAVAVIRDAGLDPERTNPFGGAIALGHPVGATGAILALRAAKHLARSGGEFAIVTLCIGGGQALAMLLRNASNG